MPIHPPSSLTSRLQANKNGDNCHKGIACCPPQGKHTFAKITTAYSPRLHRPTPLAHSPTRQAWLISFAYKSSSAGYYSTRLGRFRKGTHVNTRSSHSTFTPVNRLMSIMIRSADKFFTKIRFVRGLKQGPSLQQVLQTKTKPVLKDDVPERDSKDRRMPAISVPYKPQRKSLNVPPRDYKLFSRSSVPDILAEYAPGAPIDPLSYFAAATVLPMRANNYVLDELIDWSNIPDDPIFQLVFPQPGMLHSEDLAKVRDLLIKDVDRVTLRNEVEKVRASLNPHPAGQKALNVPRVSGDELPGMQHKYRETLLFFPAEGQYCQSYCTYCFRWAQFTSVGSAQQFQSTDVRLLRDYLKKSPCLSDVLFTGGDPMVMTAAQWARYLIPIISDPELDHISTIRIGSKSLGYWPYRYVSDKDSDDVLRLFESVVNSGRHLAFMAHFSHPRELSTPVVQDAIRRIQLTGATIRAQAPLINHVNNDPVTWATMWRAQVRMGIVPYYMFVERDTGAKHYFEVPLVRALDIYNKAVTSVSGIGRTVRGPSMSATPGKVHVTGIADLKGEKVFILKFLQGRNPDWSGKPFFAKYDEQASWLGDLKPAFGEEKFFFEDELDDISNGDTSSGRMFDYHEDFKYSNYVIE